MPDGPEIAISQHVGSADRRELAELLNAFNIEVTGYDDYRDAGCFVRDDAGRLVGGIDGYTWGGYGYVTAVWVRDSERGRGLGRRLVTAFEDEAAQRGCANVVLSTHDFQAPAFYEKLGYELVGASQDVPVGYREHHFLKRLAAER